MRKQISSGEWMSLIRQHSAQILVLNQSHLVSFWLKRLKDMDNWFEELFLKRKKFVNSARENNFDKGIRQSTVEKYPDAVHFVYELLQNAEDQGATEAHFELCTDKLIFLHNGKPFTRSDVENITGIGNSDKPQEANKIGRFGVGFKSVFAITSRPEIYTEL